MSGGRQSHDGGGFVDLQRCQHGVHPVTCQLCKDWTVAGFDRTGLWQRIDTAPAAPPDGDPPELLLWVADGRGSTRGRAAFGCVYLGADGVRRPRAAGFGGSHEWRITAWMPVPGGPDWPG